MKRKKKDSLVEQAVKNRTKQNLRPLQASRAQNGPDRALQAEMSSTDLRAG